MFISLTFIFILCLRTHAPEHMRGVRDDSRDMVLAFQHVILGTTCRTSSLAASAFQLSHPYNSKVTRLYERDGKAMLSPPSTVQILQTDRMKAAAQKQTRAVLGCVGLRGAHSPPLP